jgi:hypothetical protein
MRVDVVLLCPGPGGTGWQPQRDSTQWWNRRDAVVRCVAAFLGHAVGVGATPDLSKNTTNDALAAASSWSPTLILCFDDDGVRIDLCPTHNTTTPQTTFVPTEYNVIRLLGRAAAVPGSPVEQDGLTATRIVEEEGLKPPPSSAAHARPSLSSNSSNKRALLSYLHATCDLDFLRRHGLNSSPAAVLKKTNQAKLKAAIRDWQEQERQKQPDQWERTFRDILKYPVPATVVALLHESGHAELPVWRNNSNTPPTSHARNGTDCSNGGAATRLVLCLGAVRDMTRVEQATVRQACRSATTTPCIKVPATSFLALTTPCTTPCIKVRLGSVPEFTSKILSLVAMHAEYGVLGPAIQQLVQEQQLPPSRKRPRNELAMMYRPLRTPQLPRHTLHVVCRVDIPSTGVVSDLAARTPLLWKLVRSLVVTLWRSKVHATTASTSPSADPGDNRSTSCLRNFWHAVFADGVALSLGTEDFVTPLAAAHQAAPTEWQILQALNKRLSDLSLSSVESPTTADTATRKLLQSLFRTKDSLNNNERSNRPVGRWHVVLVDYTDIHGGSQDDDMHKDWMEEAYNSSCVETLESYTCIACLSIFDEKHPENRFAPCRKLLPEGIQISRYLHSKPSIDGIAANLTMLQHLAYQGRWGTILGKNQKTPA